MNKTFLDKYLTPIAILLAAVVIAVALFFGHGGSKDDTSQGTGAQTVNVKDIKTDGDPYIGDKNAPNTLVVFYDYQCPFCKQFEQGVSPKLISNYVNTGKLRIVFKDFQFLGNDSMDAAVFGRALWESQPDKFYPWFVAMFNAQDEEGDQGFGDLASVEKLAATIPGLDVAKVKALVASKRTAYEQAITEDRSEGAALGVNGTPTAVIGTKVLTGMSADQFYAGIASVIDGTSK
ncbi:MAG TPA: thioredoxin domain-containing protein [Candidatus Paceibacterota bacterium]|nr:thioredoxin domain-containing protein [Candidatus Paceibacterota bacterium]